MMKRKRVFLAVTILAFSLTACTAGGILPGKPGYTHRLTADILAAGRAAGPGDAAEVLAAAAGRRIDEIAAAADPSLVTILVKAYVKTVSEGIVVNLERMPGTDPARRTTGDRLHVCLAQQAARLQRLIRSLAPPMARLVEPALEAAEQAIVTIATLAGPDAGRL